MATRKYDCNDLYFEQKTLSSARWAGYIAADGNIHNNIIGFNIKKDDEILLSEFIKAIQFTGNISNRKIKTSVNGYNYNTEVSNLKISSYRNIAVLEKIYNITPRKSLTLQPPDITDEEMVKAYIIGYIDGDGYIGFSKTKKPYYYERLHLEISGTKDLLEWIKLYFDKWIPNLGKETSVRQYNKIYKYSIYNSRAYEIGNLLYQCPVFKLERKWNNLQVYYSGHKNNIENKTHKRNTVIYTP